ncbi:MAG: hypothetical protein WBE41_23530 [Terracidiphilus sp.]
MDVGNQRKSSIWYSLLTLSRWFTLVCPLMAATVLPAQIKIEAHEPAIIRDGNGAQRMKIVNDGQTAVPLGFTVGAFYDDTAHAQIEAPKITFSLDSGGNLPPTLGPKQSIEAIVEFHGFTASLTAHAAMFNQGTPVGVLRLVAVDTPLNIGLEGEGTADNPIPYSFKRTAVIALKNSGKDYVTLDWKFMIGGTVEGSGTAIMVPGGLSRLILSPTSDVYSNVDSLKPRQLNGVLLLRPHTPPGIDTSLFNLQPLPVSVTMDRWAPSTTQVFFAGFVMVLLLLGAVLSLLSNAILPDIQKKLAYEKTVGSLADRTSTISNRINSYLRVLLRLDRKKIEKALNDVHWYSISTGEKIDAAAAAMDKLEKRLVVTESLDRLRRRFEVVSTSAPPSASDLIDQTLEAAASRLGALDLSDDAVAAVNNLLGKAQLDMDNLEDAGLQTKRVADNFSQIKSRLRAFPPEYYPDLRAALPGIFHIFDQPFDDTDKLVPSMLFAIDHGITAGHIALDYAMVRATIASSGPLGCGTPGAAALDRLTQRECRLLELLGTLSWKALRGANLLVQQMREDIYERDVLDEIKKHRDPKDQIVRIAYDTLRVRPYLPVFFSLAFDNPRYANAAALRCVVFRWTFPKELLEDTATVCHYFVGDEPSIPAKPSEAAPVASPGPSPKAGSDDRHSPQNPIDKKEMKLRNKLGFSTQVSLEVHCPDAPGESAILGEVVQVDPPAKWTNSRTGVELARFLLAFGAALAVLEAGIMDQLKKLDLLAAIVAVIALGFGADSIKNILGQAPKPASPAKK